MNCRTALRKYKRGGGFFNRTKKYLQHKYTQIKSRFNAKKSSLKLKPNTPPKSLSPMTTPLELNPQPEPLPSEERVYLPKLENDNDADKIENPERLSYFLSGRRIFMNDTRDGDLRFDQIHVGACFSIEQGMSKQTQTFYTITSLSLEPSKNFESYKEGSRKFRLLSQYDDKQKHILYGTVEIQRYKNGKLQETNENIECMFIDYLDYVDRKIGNFVACYLYIPDRENPGYFKLINAERIGVCDKPDVV